MQDVHADSSLVASQGVVLMMSYEPRRDMALSAIKQYARCPTVGFVEWVKKK